MARNVRLILIYISIAFIAFWLGVIAMALYVRSTSQSTSATPLAATSAPAQQTPISTLTIQATVQPTNITPTVALIPSAIVGEPVIATVAPLPTLTTLPDTATTDELSATVLLLELVNAARDGNNCDQPLTLQSKLTSVAQSHAVDMADKKFIDHNSSDGASYTDRLDRAGYQYIRRGENIAAGFIEPEKIFAMWMDEPEDGPHRVNILNCFYEHAGIGLAFRDDGYPYWVLDLVQLPE